MPTLTLTPWVYQYIQHLCHHADTEVGFFLISDPDEPFRAIDLWVPEQDAETAYTEFNGESMADGLRHFASEGILPERCARIWGHTHPNIGATPSGTDKETFDRDYAAADWAIMFILCKGGDMTAKLRAKCQGLELTALFDMDIDVDYTVTPEAFTDEHIKELLDTLETKVHRRYRATTTKPTIYESWANGGNRSPGLGFNGSGGLLDDDPGSSGFGKARKKSSKQDEYTHAMFEKDLEAANSHDDFERLMLHADTDHMEYKVWVAYERWCQKNSEEMDYYMANWYAT